MAGWIGCWATLTAFQIPATKKFQGAGCRSRHYRAFSLQQASNSRNLEISLPINLCDRTLRPRKYNKPTNTWMDGPMQEGYQVPNIICVSEDTNNGTNGTNKTKGKNINNSKAKVCKEPSSKPVIQRHNHFVFNLYSC